MAELMRRLAALEERAATFSTSPSRGSTVSFFASPSTKASGEKFTSLEAAPNGSIMALREENEVGGARVIMAKFPSPEYGWVSA